MTDPLRVTASERETVRAFVVDLDRPQAKAWSKVHSNLEAAIGAELDPNHLETFPSDDLKDFGLTQFLIDGYGIAEANIAPDRARLDDAKPQIVLLRARAFKGVDLTLTPKLPLIHLGTYGQAKADPSAPTPAREIEETVAGPVQPNNPEPNPKGSLLPILIFLGLAVVLFAVLILPKL